MPEEEKKTVDIDTSGPETEINVPEEKDEAVVDTAPENTEQETVKEVVQETKEDKKLEEYSTGVQSRIAKLTRKMREAERREAAALQYAEAIDKKRKLDREIILKKYMTYISNQSQKGVPIRSMTRHILGLYHGESNAKLFRRLLSGKIVGLEHLNDWLDFKKNSSTQAKSF